MAGVLVQRVKHKFELPPSSEDYVWMRDCACQYAVYGCPRWRHLQQSWAERLLRVVYVCPRWRRLLCAWAAAGGAAPGAHAMCALRQQLSGSGLVGHTTWLKGTSMLKHQNACCIRCEA